jgi:hypothetical protein
VIATADAEAHASAGEHVRHGEVFGEPERMPHRRDVEAAPDLQPLGLVGQVERHHQDVRDAFIAFALEMMLGEPEGVAWIGAFRARRRW